MSNLRLVAAVAALSAASGCVHAPPVEAMRQKAGSVCWKLRENMTDWRLAATQCAQELQKMDGVETAWVNGYTVRVKFKDYTDQFGIWMK